MVQYIKGKWKTGEKKLADRLAPEMTLLPMGDGFTWDTKNPEADIATTLRIWEVSQEAIASGKYDVVILDEINVVMKLGYLDPQFVRRRPQRPRPAAPRRPDRPRGAGGDRRGGGRRLGNRADQAPVQVGREGPVGDRILNANERTPTRIKSTAQVLLCKGCCCGKTERGLPEVPVDRLKAAWKAEKLNRAVQLTISGCLGPCDLPNVVVVMTADRVRWYGLIAGDADYDALLDWARACQAEDRALEPPKDIVQAAGNWSGTAPVSATPVGWCRAQRRPTTQGWPGGISSFCARHQVSLAPPARPLMTET